MLISQFTLSSDFTEPLSVESAQQPYVPEPARVLVGDGTRMGCDLLTQTLERSPYGFRVVGAVTNPGDVVATAKKNEADVALISVGLDGGPGSGIKALRELAASGLCVRPISLLDDDRQELVVEAFSSGAKGVITRAEPVELLWKSIHSVHRGQVWASSKQLQSILEVIAGARPSGWGTRRKLELTAREQEVASWVAEGFSNREIARRLRISENTVKNYLFRMFGKLGVSNRSELILCTLHHNGDGRRC